MFWSCKKIEETTPNSIVYGTTFGDADERQCAVSPSGTRVGRWYYLVVCASSAAGLGPEVHARLRLAAEVRQADLALHVPVHDLRGAPAVPPRSARLCLDIDIQPTTTKIHFLKEPVKFRFVSSQIIADSLG